MNEERLNQIRKRWSDAFVAGLCSRGDFEDVDFLCNRIAELEKEPLREVGIQEICEWIVGEYPSDVFTGISGDEGAILIATLRDKAAEILKFRKEAADAVRDEDK